MEQCSGAELNKRIIAFITPIITIGNLILSMVN
jgi:hypothetical protein